MTNPKLPELPTDPEEIEFISAVVTDVLTAGLMLFVQLSPETAQGQAERFVAISKLRRLAELQRLKTPREADDVQG